MYIVSVSEITDACSGSVRCKCKVYFVTYLIQWLFIALAEMVCTLLQLHNSVFSPMNTFDISSGSLREGERYNLTTKKKQFSFLYHAEEY